MLYDRAGTRVELPYDVNLWQVQPEQDLPSSILAPIDPVDYLIDPLTLL